MNFPDLSRPDGHIGRQVLYFETLNSTFDICHDLARQGAESGTVVIAGGQTGGKGRLGRPFQSLPGKGLYLSVLLRPEEVTMEELSRLTPWAAVAVCRTLERLTGLSFSIKWVNDILLGGKKVCGILTELDFSEGGALNCAILGIGIDLTQTAEDFGELAGIATSLAQHMDTPPSPAQTTRVLLEELERLWEDFPHAQAEYLAEYRKRCNIAGRQARFSRNGQVMFGTVLGVNEDFSLGVRLPDGGKAALNAGEVTFLP